MRLWRIWQNVNDDYDTYDSAVVAAETTQEAQHTKFSYGWTDPSYVEVELLGEAVPGTKAGIVLASFNAG